MKGLPLSSFIEIEIDIFSFFKWHTKITYFLYQVMFVVYHQAKTKGGCSILLYDKAGSGARATKVLLSSWHFPGWNFFPPRLLDIMNYKTFINLKWSYKQCHWLIGFSFENKLQKNVWFNSSTVRFEIVMIWQNKFFNAFVKNILVWKNDSGPGMQLFSFLI